MPAKKNRLKTPRLRFTPHAWAKLLFLRDYGETEVGGFGVSAEDDLLLIEQIVLVKQTCSVVTVAFDDASVADYFDAQVETGRTPAEFARIWIHTHPGDCPLPSNTDEATFDRAFGNTDWAVMFILARDGESYARLRCNAGPQVEVELPVEIDFGSDFAASEFEVWETEYLANVTAEEPMPRFHTKRTSDRRTDFEVDGINAESSVPRSHYWYDDFEDHELFPGAHLWE